MKIVNNLFVLIFLGTWTFNSFAHPIWEPKEPTELIVPAGAGGGADKMARTIVSIVNNRHLTPYPMVAVNKTGGSGTEGYLYVKRKNGSSYSLIITLSNFFILPREVGADFHWDQFSPIARMTLDDFILWVNASSPYKTLDDYIKAVQNSPNAFKMGGTGAGQEDQLVTSMLERAAQCRFMYFPLGGGGDVAKALRKKEVNSTVNNPSEIEQDFRNGIVRPLGLFSNKRLALKGWENIPTIKEQGYNIEYHMLRGIFGAPEMPKEAQLYYTNLMRTVYETNEFKEYLESNALQGAWTTQPEFHKWLLKQDALHNNLLDDLGFK